MNKHSSNILLHDDPSTLDSLLDDVLNGMRLPQKRLPSKYFYDERGCQLFEEICELDEYYLTRSELSIMDQFAGEMAKLIGEQCMLIEFGSGASVKTRILLEQLQDPAVYVPVDIAREHLEQTASDLSNDYEDLEILPVCADFTGMLELPQSSSPVDRRIVYFPGSTMGNLEQAESSVLLRRIARLCRSNGGLLIGLDLQKDVFVLEAAYNDKEEVTAQFNVNLLDRLNRELDADFQLDQFRHQASYNCQFHRIEMHLVSLDVQTVTIGDHVFHIEEGESICTEYSHKYDLDQFAELAQKAGLQLIKSWTDENRFFAVAYLKVR